MILWPKWPKHKSNMSNTDINHTLKFEFELTNIYIYIYM